MNVVYFSVKICELPKYFKKGTWTAANFLQQKTVGSFSSEDRLSVVPKKSTSGNLPSCHFEGIGINATKFKKTRIHVKVTFLLPSLSLMLKLPIMSCATDHILSLESSDGNRWVGDDMGTLVPLLMGKSPPPQSLLELVCRCQKGHNSRCSCRNV